MKNYMKLYKQLILCFFGLLQMVICSCKKAIDIGQPINQLANSTVFTSDKTAQGAVAGVFGNMAAVSHMYNGNTSISLQQGLAADELVSLSSLGSPFYSNNLTSQNTYYWTEIYSEVFSINSALVGLTNATTITPAIRNQLLGEMMFARAFIYFYAVNLYGDLPIALTTDYLTNSSLNRSSQQLVYNQIIQDLKDAQGLLPDNSYLSGTGAPSTERVHPNKQSASALLARIYLYQKDWVNAESQATQVIGASSYKLEALNSVFLKGSREAIWQLSPQSSGSNNNNGDAAYLVIYTSPASNQQLLSLNSNLLNAFEPDDARLVNWIGTYNAASMPPLPATTYKFANKYKAYAVSTATPVSEYPVMLRLAEQYLIRAEARAQQENFVDARNDLGAIRSRANLLNTTANTKDALLNAIAHERQVELFTEMGHRWFDLRRTGKIDSVMSIITPKKAGTWDTYKQLIPIPAAEILINPKLFQNKGY